MYICIYIYVYICKHIIYMPAFRCMRADTQRKNLSALLFQLQPLSLLVFPAHSECWRCSLAQRCDVLVVETCQNMSKSVETCALIGISHKHTQT